MESRSLIIYKICATIFSVNSFRISKDPTGPSGIYLCVITGLRLLRLFPLSSLLGGLFGFQVNIIDGYVLLSALRKPRWFEEDFGSEVVFWTDERSVESGNQRFDDVHVHGQSLLPNWLRGYCATFLGPSNIPCHLVARLVDHFDVFLELRRNVPVTPVRDIFAFERVDLNIYV